MMNLAKQYLEGKVPTSIAVILINLALVIVLWAKFDTFALDYEVRLRALEDYKLVSEANHVEHFKVTP